MEIHGKIWGLTSELFRNNSVEIHRIEGKKGFKCSKHKHIHKYNMFYVESGILKIRIWKNAYDLVDTTIVNPQQSTVVKPGEFHRFEVLQDCVAFEIYWVVLDADDIVRQDHGGKIKIR